MVSKYTSRFVYKNTTFVSTVHVWTVYSLIRTVELHSDVTYKLVLLNKIPILLNGTFCLINCMLPRSASFLLDCFEVYLFSDRFVE